MKDTPVIGHNKTVHPEAWLNESGLHINKYGPRASVKKFLAVY